MEIWPQVSDLLRSRIGADNVSTWFEPARFLGLEDQQVRMQLPNRFFVDWITENYHEALLESFQSVVGADVARIRFLIGETRQGELFPNAEDEPPAPATKPKNGTAARRASSTNPDRRSLLMGSLASKYTFEHYVVGNSNQFAHAAAEAVANQPGTHYNPLFIYGRVGLGKTHLINAIGHRIIENDPEARIGYLSAEAFMNELITAIRKDRMDQFKNKFRRLDCLILDDVHFLAGRERTQEEFFHTFNVLYENRNQIVLTSDKFPKDIPGLEDRLRNRFEWGLIADIQPPDIETRIAIVQKKAELENLPIPAEVAIFLAQKFEANIRELEGSLTRLGAFASLAGKPITLEFAKEVMRSLVRDDKLRISVELVQRVVAEQFGLRVTDLTSTKRTKNIALARQVAMYLTRKLVASSYPQIGQRFGGRDHSTVVHGVHVIERRIREDSGFQATIDRLETTIRDEARS